MHLIKTLPGLCPFPAPLRRFLRKFADILYYDGVELLVIAIGVVVILLIWEFTFWQ